MTASQRQKAAFRKLMKREIALIEFPALEIIISEGMARKGIPCVFRQEGEENILTVHIAFDYFLSLPVTMDNAERLIVLMRYFINRPDCAAAEWPGARRFRDLTLARNWDRVASGRAG